MNPEEMTISQLTAEFEATRQSIKALRGADVSFEVLARYQAIQDEIGRRTGN